MPTSLVSPSELAAHLADPDWCVLDCRFSLQDPAAGAADYAQGHIPGAAYVSLDADLSGPRTASSGRHPLPDPALLAQRLGALGIGEQTQVVAYDASAGLFAARAWWLLRALGHTQVAVLDGGLQAWRAGGGALATESAPRPARLFRWHGQPLGGLTAADVAGGLVGDRLRLIDVRAAERFEGRSEPLDPVAGHVPGAINLPHTLALDADGRFRSAQALRELFAAQAAAAPGAIVCMCGSGVTACHTLLALEVAGLPGARLYAGSWSEWCRDPTRPIATGPA